MDITEPLWNGLKNYVEEVIGQEVFVVLQPMTYGHFSRQTIAVAVAAFTTKEAAMEGVVQMLGPEYKQGGTSLGYRGRGKTIAIFRVRPEWGGSYHPRHIICKFSSKEFLELTFAGYLFPTFLFGEWHRMK